MLLRKQQYSLASFDRYDYATCVKSVLFLVCCQKRVPTVFLSTGSADLCKVPSSLSTESVCQSSARCSLFQIIAA